MTLSSPCDACWFLRLASARPGRPPHAKMRLDLRAPATRWAIPRSGRLIFVGRVGNASSPTCSQLAFPRVCLFFSTRQKSSCVSWRAVPLHSHHFAIKPLGTSAERCSKRTQSKPIRMGAVQHSQSAGMSRFADRRQSPACRVQARVTSSASSANVSRVIEVGLRQSFSSASGLRPPHILRKPGPSTEKMYFSDCCFCFTSCVDLA